MICAYCHLRITVENFSVYIIAEDMEFDEPEICYNAPDLKHYPRR